MPANVAATTRVGLPVTAAHALRTGGGLHCVDGGLQRLDPGAFSSIPASARLARLTHRLTYPGECALEVRGRLLDPEERSRAREDIRPAPSHRLQAHLDQYLWAKPKLLVHDEQLRLGLVDPPNELQPGLPCSLRDGHRRLDGIQEVGGLPAVDESLDGVSESEDVYRSPATD